MGGCTSAPLAPKFGGGKKAPEGNNAAMVTTMAADISTPLVTMEPAKVSATTEKDIPVAQATVVTAVTAAEPPKEGVAAITTQESFEEKSNDDEFTVLKTLVVMGSGRKTSSRMGDRVGAFFCAQLEQRKIKHVVDYIDVSQLDLPFLETPQYHYPAGEAPKHLQALAERVQAADCFVFISPEYNHSLSPALSNFVAHFSQTAYMFKPSAIAVYSMGPYGGVRAAMQLRALTGECGCDAVAAIFAAPAVQTSLDEAGKPVGEDGDRLVQQADKVIAQLEWYGEAFKIQRETVGLPQE